MTSRGWWFLLTVLAMVLLGVMLPSRWSNPLALLGLTLLGWFLFEWVLFEYRARWVLLQLKFRRDLEEQGRHVPQLWAGRIIRVRVQLQLQSRLGLPYLIVEDPVPYGVEVCQPPETLTLNLAPRQCVELRSTIRCESAGEVRFEGLALQLADLQGFFYHRTFLRQPQVYPVLPPLTDSRGRPRSDKRHNLLLPPGIHRFRKPGSGSELLDLRDYRPGDPPKMIAWKPSARRDRLITKEFESEVPIRCTLFVDTSQAVRLGKPGQSPLAKLIGIAAAVAQAAAADRDLAGLTLFDEHGTTIIDPHRGSRHLIQILTQLSVAARLKPAAVAHDLETLMRLAFPIADRFYPDLLTKQRNATPWRMFWKPLLDSRWGWWGLALLPLPLLIFWAPARQQMIALAELLAERRVWFWPWFLLVWLSPWLLAGMLWLFHGIKGMLAPAQPRRARRKKLAALLALRYGLGAGGIGLLLEDDVAFAQATQRFLAEHHAPYPLPLYDRQGRYQFRSVPKVEVLAQALTRSVARGRDNELFVLLVDLLELTEAELDPLLRAVRVALARHHEVILVCPWHADIPAPPDERNVSEEKPFEEPVAPTSDDPEAWQQFLQQRLIERYHRAYRQVRRLFGRLGVVVIRANQDDPVQLILDRLDRLRQGGIHYR